MIDGQYRILAKNESCGAPDVSNPASKSIGSTSAKSFEGDSFEGAGPGAKTQFIRLKHASGTLSLTYPVRVASFSVLSRTFCPPGVRDVLSHISLHEPYNPEYDTGYGKMYTSSFCLGIPLRILLSALERREGGKPKSEKLECKGTSDGDGASDSVARGKPTNQLLSFD